MAAKYTVNFFLEVQCSRIYHSAIVQSANCGKWIRYKLVQPIRSAFSVVANQSLRLNLIFKTLKSVE